MTLDTVVPGSQDIWVFGYGSLIWKPPIHYEAKVVGYIKNYVRRFWQESHDHRGTPENPGRVVTLIPHDEWVLTEDVPSRSRRRMWKQLGPISITGKRQVANGYTVHNVDVYSAESDTVPAVKDAMVYIATTDNEAYVGPAPMDTIAQQIYETYGPSGWNAEYLLNLAVALREISPDAKDDHLFELERLVQHLIQQHQQD
ncbi:hypothetical protein [Absidia glauca]|uniref:glutathione-specific gamma-glutamylcyclotransferase n=1 Tax=Absidia glauca TaxID=4829 RepID=A0A168QTR6_ABSGL|nr:hypothetical protein [Absidia glauca]